MKTRICRLSPEDTRELTMMRQRAGIQMKLLKYCHSPGFPSRQGVMHLHMPWSPVAELLGLLSASKRGQCPSDVSALQSARHRRTKTLSHLLGKCLCRKRFCLCLSHARIHCILYAVLAPLQPYIVGLSSAD
ncbi:hypothetical protein KQX54_007784 [Cotesia glomerata]|uniref:Uncharacterized protein n=1 Tax=Cotesia glomerata TaxID=32391 RepID=A0AAV7IYB8_COTGL|nr:hypothetical protein KQX54_007784 [Cotesia glomerata]